MGMCAEVIAIGPFSKSIAKYLEYPEKHYESTRQGVIVSCIMFGISEGNSVSREFAGCLGITNAWDFNQHHIDNTKIDIIALREFATKYGEYSGDVQALISLMKSGFEFHFVPNG